MDHAAAAVDDDDVDRVDPDPVGDVVDPDTGTGVYRRLAVDDPGGTWPIFYRDKTRATQIETSGQKHGCEVQ